ncbi:hypothetical protein BC835DRAFT_1351319 [Cytidiella melzeri]|nr:hypothetical protein BC835DRAFT_1351319 [Cytidiella melzeri]
MSSSTVSVNGVHEAPSTGSSEPATSPKRLSRLNDFMLRSRTSSLPVRPHSSSGIQSLSTRQTLGHRLGTIKGKGRDRGDGEEAVSSKAASSSVSVVDPFAANPAASASFVTYSPTPSTFPPSRVPAALNVRPRTVDSDAAESIHSVPTSPVSPTQPTQTFASATARRRGSILVAASDALSSFARKTPMRSLHLNMNGIGRHNSTKAFNHTTQPIILTEVIEISESAVRASKLREEEEAERDRLRDAAARALGINDKDADSVSMSSRKRSAGFLDLGETLEEEESIDQQAWCDDAQTPTATSLRSLTPSFTHSRSRSGSYISPHALLSQPARSPTPQSSPHLLSTTQPARSQTPKSHSTPPSSTFPTLRVNTLSPSKMNSFDDTLSGPVAEIPPFPSTPAALSPFTQLSGTMPRYYPAPSLLMFTLTKQWKNRYLVFTCPHAEPSTQKPVFRSPWGTGADSTGQRGHNTIPIPSFLHLFKTSGSEEKEVERLEINEESVVYVAEGEVGGRKGVIKVGGSLRKKNSPSSRYSPSAISSRTSSSSMGSVEDASDPPPLSHDNSLASGSTSAEGRTMWVVQITDPGEAKDWIGAIKGSVLNQRSIRAGLGMSSVVNGLEPRGDLDVVLSMRAQGLFPTPSMSTSPTARSIEAVSPTKSTFTAESNHTPHLTRSQSVTASTGYSSTAASMISGDTGSTLATSYSSGSSSPIPRATTALKSLFTIASNRPRSPSTSSLTPPSSALDDDETRPEDSFGHAGVSLMGMSRSNCYAADRPLSPTTPTVPNTPRAGTPIMAPEALLDRKILPDPNRQLMESEIASEPAVTKQVNGQDISARRPREVDENYVIHGRISSEGVTSIALQPPPPRKRAGTTNSNTVTVAVSSPTELPPPSYTYSHANSSTAESLGVSMGVKSSSLLTPPLPSTPLSSGSGSAAAKSKDRRMTRASWSSVSTYGSGEQSPTSLDESRSRRWSRRSSIPHRMSPPYPAMTSPPSSPLNQDLPIPSMRHPYASEARTVSRSSSVGSGHSRVSELQVRPFSTKRASVASLQSWSTSSTHSYSAISNGKSIVTPGRLKSAHRTSMPPPQRPAPNSALPPTPSENGHGAQPMLPTLSLPAPKTLRESLILRGNKRLSTAPPTLPPASALPPRPDEPAYRPPVISHRRSSSQGTPIGSYVFSNAPSTFVQTQAPTPPPNSPLPLPTRPHTATTPSSSSSPTRSTSLIKRRLRILSSPPSSPPMTIPPAPPIADFAESFFSPMSIPESPIIPKYVGGPITTLQNDPSFLSISPATPQRDNSILEDAPQGLSPPPRRGSRQVATPDREMLQHEVEPLGTVDIGLGEPAHRGEVESLGPTPGPPPEVDAFASLLAPTTVRSSEYSAVSLVDVRI